MKLNESFGLLGLRPTTTGTAAIDIDRVCEVLSSTDESDQPARNAVIDAVATALANATAFVNPKAVIIAGPWADNGGLRDKIAERIAKSAVPVEIREPGVKGNSFLIGAQLDALDRARRSILFR